MKFQNSTLIATALLALCFEPTHGTAWQRSAKLDREEKIHAQWNITHDDGGDFLDFQITAPTRGYIGIGFSSNGAMRGSDIVVGWVDSAGKGHLRDFHGVGNEMPVLDEVQNYQLVEAKESWEGTTVRFRRPLLTCDEHDMDITNDTMRVIWSYHDEDPVIKGDAITFKWHGPSNRGAKSLFLVHKPLLASFPDEPGNFDSHVRHWELMMSNNTVEGEDTVYYCKIVKLPRMDKKYHMIGYRPIIGNAKFVHHICMYECNIPAHMGGTASVFEQHISHPGGRCYTPNMPPEWAKYCGGLFQSWVPGSDGEMFPQHVGIPLGEEFGGTTYFMFEVHYDNPAKATFTDTSGIRIFYTDQLRPYDASTLMVSYRITPFMLIPPKQTDFKTYGICASECTQRTFPTEGIKIVSVMLHAHLAGRRIKLRHFRDGKELPVVAEDKAYDFNYQQSRLLSKEVTVLPGDELITECEYDTMDRDRAVLGGLSSREEMCQSFIMYYPKMELTWCSSQSEFHDFFGALGITRVSSSIFSPMNLPYNPNSWPKDKQEFEPPDDPKELEKYMDSRNVTDLYDLMDINEPKELRNSTVGRYLQSLQWQDRSFAKNFETELKYGRHYSYCTLVGRRREHLKNFITTFPKNELEAEAHSHCLRLLRQQSSESFSNLPTFATTWFTTFSITFWMYPRLSCALRL